MIPACAMQKYWNGMDVSRKFYTEDNIPLIIRSGGFWNHESGPDFKLLLAKYFCSVSLSQRVQSPSILLTNLKRDMLS